MKKIFTLILWIGLSQSIFLSSEALAKEGFVFAQADSEKKKIEFLLTEIEHLKGARFWRNGSSYSPQQAAEHLRMKWSKAGSAVKTASDFIEKIASKSSMSGKAYEIEFDNGTKVKTIDFLTRKLKELK